MTSQLASNRYRKFSLTSSPIRPITVAIWLLIWTSVCAQTPPEIGYVFPPCGAPGSTVDVRIGGYNWTPDMQLFSHDARGKFELTGSPSEVLVPPPPYWFGKKARDNDFPLPREFPARVTIDTDAPVGAIRWQAANANGATATGVFLVAHGNVQTETVSNSSPSEIPVTSKAVVGQISKLEEVDRYSWTATRTGPVSLELWSRRLGSQMNAVLEVRDSAGKLVADGADTAGHDLQLTFAAQAGQKYLLNLFDADFRGHPSFGYRLLIHEGPRVIATLPAAGKAGTSAKLQLVGVGLATGLPQLESITQDVTFPATVSNPSNRFEFQVDTSFGKSEPFALPLSDFPEALEGTVATATAPCSSLPIAITGSLQQVREEDRFSFTGTKGSVWSVTCRSAKRGIPLDLTLAILDSTGKELSRTDDMPGSLDSSIVFSVPSDGAYQIRVSDQSGQAGNPSAVYRLTVEAARPDFQLSIPDRIALPLAGTTKLPIKVNRLGGMAAAITVELSGLPHGVTAPSPLIIPADKSEFAVDLTCASDAAATAGLVNLQGTAKVGDQDAVRRVDPLVVAVVMKPRVKITPEGLDDVRKWPRGSTYLAPVHIERLEGFTGEVMLEQTAHQQRIRQGITGPDFTVSPDVTRVEYPVYLPEWLETTKTSRIILNGVTKVADPKGNVRHLLNKMELRIGMLPVGALLKITNDAGELEVPANQPFEIPVQLTRSQELNEPAIVEVIMPPNCSGHWAAAPQIVPSGQSQVSVRIEPSGGSHSAGPAMFTLRATVLRGGKWPVVSETACSVEFVDGK